MSETEVSLAFDGNEKDVASVHGFLRDIGLRATDSPGATRIVVRRIEPDGRDGDGTVVDLDFVACHPEEARSLLLAATPFTFVESPDDPARVRVAVATHLWRPAAGQRTHAPSIPLDVKALLPISDPQADTAIAVVCHNDGALLIDALASIRLGAPERCHVVVIDDGSTDPMTCLILDALAQNGIPVARQEAGGWSRACNLGAGLTGASALLAMGGNQLLSPGFMDEAAGHLDLDAGCGLVLSGDARCEPDAVAELLAGDDWGSCALLRRRAIEEAGGWDVDLEAGPHWDMWLSIAGAGWGIWRTDGRGFARRAHGGTTVSTVPDVDAWAAIAMAIAAKHQMLYAPHLPAVVGRLASNRADHASMERLAELTRQLDAARDARDRERHEAAGTRQRDAELDPTRLATLRVSVLEQQLEMAERELSRMRQSARARVWRRVKALMGQVRSSDPPPDTP